MVRRVAEAKNALLYVVQTPIHFMPFIVMADVWLRHSGWSLRKQGYVKVS